MPYLLTFAGFILLLGGGELLVRGAVAISLRAGISPLLVGMTIVAACTSAPELVVSVQAALGGHSDMAVGNVVGSNIANVGLILGLAAAIMPISIDPTKIRRDGYFMLAAGAGLLALGLLGGIGRITGISMVVVLALFIATSYRIERRAPDALEGWHSEEAVERAEPSPPIAAGVLMLAGGLVALVFGSNLLIKGATEIAQRFGVPEAVIGLTVIALGTSLPELMTSLVAAFRGRSDLAVGNIIGSNAFNIMLILGTTAAIKPVSISTQMARVDIPIMLGFMLVGTVPLMRSGRVARLLGTLLWLGYVAYVVTAYL